MEVDRTKAGIGAALLVVAVVLFLVLKGGSDDSSDDSSATTGGAIPTIQIKDGEPVGGIQKLSFTDGGEIKFRVTSDADWEIHFHGYDIAKDVKAGGSVTYDVPADTEGVFEAEIEDTGTQIAEITVNPS